MSILLAVVLAGLAPARQDSLRRVTKAVVSSGYLWLLGSDGDFYHLDFSTRKLTRDSVLGRVVDLALTSEGHLFALTVKKGRTLIIDEGRGWTPVATVPTVPADTVLTLGVLGLRRAVLTTAAVLVEVKDGEWRRRELKGMKGLGSLQPAAAWTSDGSLYVGANFGEFGGHLWRISLASGRVTEVVRHKDGDPFGGPLDPRVDPVTAVIRDPTDGRCVLASIGLLHMGLASGRIVRTCGDSIAVQFEEPCPPEPGAPPAFQRMCRVPVFGLAEAKDGFWAVTPFGTLRFDQHGVAERHVMPKLEDIGGVLLSREIPGVVLVGSDINWSASVSGLTPLIAVLN